MESDQADSLHTPPDLYRRTVEELASQLGLDAKSIIDGQRVTHQGISFWLLHHGELDTDGITIAMRTGSLPENAPGSAYRQLLAHNALSPAALHGYFGMMPDHDEVLYCIRVDLKTVPEPVEFILLLVERIAAEIEATFRFVNSQLAEMRSGPARQSFNGAAQAG